MQEGTDKVVMVGKVSDDCRPLARELRAALKLLVYHDLYPDPAKTWDDAVREAKRVLANTENL